MLWMTETPGSAVGRSLPATKCVKGDGIEWEMQNKLIVISNNENPILILEMITIHVLELWKQ